ncbi:hypothetical protein CAEBREN_21773 [Caenorhabditis brenneri]|uniref:NR LBD domain-containing protein n=1 Tax=Caenorhabditis brenneri TaxID=135651 RepID=G0NEP2_CAEBE|nr:hypothetical protein CAEBREN_21773 [Caenorhabditis brenneri]
MKCDKIQTTQKVQKLKSKPKSREIEIPQSVGVFIGRSNLIIFCAPQPESETYPKQILDVRFLIDQASMILKKGLHSPVSSNNSLEKLAFGLQQIRRGSRSGKTQFVSNLGKEQFLALWQDDMLKIAKWMTYFDEFQILPHDIKIKILKGIWRVWSRLERLATTVIGRQNKMCEENMLMLDLEENQVVFYTNKTTIDLSWYSRYNAHQLKLFGYRYLDEKTDDLIQELVNLQPSDVEMSYMMCQLCFYYVGKRYQGVVLEIADRLMEKLSNDLHSYYTSKMKTEKYAGRLASMMRINNQIQKGIYQRRATADLMRIFDVFYVEFSDPEMFIDA